MRQPRPLRIRRILHATDFSAASRPAFDEALALARQYGAELLVLFVIEGRPPALGRAWTRPETYEVIARREATEAFQALVGRVNTAGVRTRAIVLTGYAAEEILKTAEAERVDLIVLGTHGRSGLSRVFLGSVAQRVLQFARCPVLTVRSGRPARRRAAVRR